jgi:hypothetical protein
MPDAMKLTTRRTVLALALTAALACGYDCGSKALAQDTRPAAVVVRLASEGDPVSAANDLPAGGTLLLPRGVTWKIPWARSLAPRDGVTIGAYGDRAKLHRPRLIFEGGSEAVRIAGKGVTLDSLDLVNVPGGKYVGVNANGAVDAKIENCSIRAFRQNVLAEGARGLTLRGNLIADAYTLWPGQHAAGVYLYDTTGWVIDRCAFVRNGRSSVYEHAVYVAASCGPGTITGSTFVANSSHGAQMRSGGDCLDSLFLDNPIGLSHGHVNGSAVYPGGVTGTLERLVFVGGGKIAGQPRGYCVEFGNAAGTVARDLLSAHDSQKWDAPFVINASLRVSNPADVAKPSRLELARLFAYDWPGHPDRRGVLRTATAATGKREDIRTLDPPAPVDLRALLGDVEAAARRDPWTAAKPRVDAARKALGLDGPATPPPPPEPTPEQLAARQRIREIDADLAVRAITITALAGQLKEHEDARAALVSERAERVKQAG